MARSSAKRIIATLLFVLALATFLAWMFVLFADAQKIDDIPGVGEMDPVALGVTIGLGVIALLLVLLLLIRSYDKKQNESDSAEAFFVPEHDQKEIDASAEQEFDDAFANAGPELVVYDIWRLSPQARAWGATSNGTSSYHFPRNVKAGVYANDYLETSSGHRLKLRTLLAGPADVPLGEMTVDAEVPESEDAPVEALRGDDFMAELEERYTGMKDTGDYDNFQELDDPFGDAPGEITGIDVAPEVEAAPAKSPAPDEELFYDYHGDVHQVIDVEGIGPVFAEKLTQVGVKTTSRLCYEDADEIAQRIGTEPKRVRTWQSMAELMKVTGIGPQYAEALARAGIEGISELKKRSASVLSEQVNEYLAGLDNAVLGTSISERRVTGWKEAAKDMRRVRSRIPEE